jgi:hypothetical protein
MVERVVRPRPDHGHRTQRISDTVALTGTICETPDGSLGRGRACSLFFLDEMDEGVPPAVPNQTPERTLHQA